MVDDLQIIHRVLLNTKNKNEYGIHNNRTYKEFLIKNADLMMKRNFDEKKR